MLVYYLAVFCAALLNSVNNVANKHVVAPHTLGALQATFLIQILAALCSVPFIIALHQAPPTAAWLPVLVAVALGLGGYVVLMLAFTREDVSVVGPILGLKVIFLAVLESLLHRTIITPGVALGALVSMVGITFISQRDRWSLQTRDLLRPGVVLMAVAAFAYAVCDLFIKQAITNWNGNSLGVTLYITCFMGVGSLLALAGQACWSTADRVQWSRIRPVLWPLLISGATVLGTQYALFTAFGLSTSVTFTNIVYNIRGLLIVGLTAFLVLGRGSTVERAGWRAYTFRATGAVLTLVAIVLVMYWK